MIRINRAWVDENWELLGSKLPRLDTAEDHPHEFFFEPEAGIYERLGSGDERDVQYVASSIAAHLGIIAVPTVRYEWGLKMEPEVAGQIRVTICVPHIQIPFFYVGKKYSLGGILAHEMTHALLLPKGIALQDSAENECLTDMAAVYFGLGKLLLNGSLDEGGGLGYLSPDLIAYSIKKACVQHAIDVQTALSNLTNEARGLFERV